jgi:hypothetical protein
MHLSIPKLKKHTAKELKTPNMNKTFSNIHVKDDQTKELIYIYLLLKEGKYYICNGNTLLKNQKTTINESLSNFSQEIIKCIIEFYALTYRINLEIITVNNYYRLLSM